MNKEPIKATSSLRFMNMEDYAALEARARWAEEARAVLEDVSFRLFSMPQLRALLAAYPQPVQE